MAYQPTSCIPVSATANRYIFKGGVTVICYKTLLYNQLFLKFSEDDETDPIPTSLMEDDDAFFKLRKVGLLPKTLESQTTRIPTVMYVLLLKY